MSNYVLELKNMSGIAFGKTWEVVKSKAILATLTTSAAFAFSYILYKRLSADRKSGEEEKPFEIDQLLQDVSLMVRTAVRLKNKIVELQFLATHAPTQSQRERAQIILFELIQSQIPVYKHLSSLDQPQENGELEDDGIEASHIKSEEEIESHLQTKLSEQSTEERQLSVTSMHQQRIRYNSITSIASPGSDSFISARDDEFIDRLHEFEEQKIKNEFYFEGKRLSHLVDIRKNRVDLVKAIDLEDFKSKVYCLRIAMKILVTMSAERDYMENSLKTIITSLLNIANGDSSKFVSCVDEMLYYIRADPRSEFIMREELSNRRVPVVEIGPFDVILDWILMDLLEDMQKPPQTISSILSVTWFSVSRRASGVTTLINATITAKRSRLKYADGFMSRFYDISSSATPTLAASALIQDMASHKPVILFQQELKGFLCDIFDLEVSDYTSPVTLTTSIVTSLRNRTEKITRLLINDSSAMRAS